MAAEIGRFVPDDRLHSLLRLVNHSMGIRNLFSRCGLGGVLKSFANGRSCCSPDVKPARWFAEICSAWIHREAHVCCGTFGVDTFFLML